MLWRQYYKNDRETKVHDIGCAEIYKTLFNVKKITARRSRLSQPVFKSDERADYDFERCAKFILIIIDLSLQRNKETRAVEFTMQ